MNQAKVSVTLKSDSGRIKISTWASSLEEAKTKVLRDQNAPESAVLSVKVQRPTISDIKYQTAETSPYYFSHNTMKCFGQRMKDFSVRSETDGRFRISAPMRDRYTGKVIGESVRFFNPFTKTLDLS